MRRMLREGLLATLAVVMLLGCGPGTGGTGTGTAALNAFGATAAPVCSASFAAAIDCPGSASPAAPIGTPGVTYAEHNNGPARARFDGNAVRFTVGADVIVFDGEWGVAAVGTRYFGTTAGGLASLAVDNAVGGGLVATLRDSNEAILSGPVELVRVP